MNHSDPAFGRRDYDVEIAKLQFQVVALQKENAELKQEMLAELKKLRAENKEMLDAWKSAKGITSFIKWSASLALSIGVLWATIKGVKA